MSSYHYQHLLVSVIIVSLTLASSEPDVPSAYDMLESFGFPKGILPEGVQSYILRPDGGFEVVLSSDCEFKVEGAGYLLNYRRRIAGRVAPGELMELQGISIRVVVFWFWIGGVVERDGMLSFYVGPLSASFPAANFMKCPVCRSGCSSAANATVRLMSES